MTNRVATCSCGQLRATCEGEAALISLCNCDECRKRTGSAFGLATIYLQEQVKTEGDSKTYTRNSDAGPSVTFHFCPNCGSSVYWFAQRAEGRIIVAGGAFGDQNLPMPRQSVFDEKRHSWLEFPDEMATRTG